MISACKKHHNNNNTTIQDLLAISIFLEQEYLITQASCHLNIIAQRIGKPTLPILNAHLPKP